MSIPLVSLILFSKKNKKIPSRVSKHSFSSNKIISTSVTFFFFSFLVYTDKNTEGLCTSLIFVSCEIIDDILSLYVYVCVFLSLYIWILVYYDCRVFDLLFPVVLKSMQQVDNYINWCVINRSINRVNLPIEYKL